ncbi:SCO family protein [Kaarinaea lacus]
MKFQADKLLPLTVVSILVLLIGVSVHSWPVLSTDNPIPEHLQDIGGDFVLQSADGTVSLESLRGKVVLVFFGYTNCPDVCPLTLTHWSMAFDELSKRELENVRGIFVSVDPARDTTEKLRNYTVYFHNNIVGVTGTHEELAKIATAYRSDYHLENDGKGENYLVDHMSFVYVLDRQGKVHDLLSHDSAPGEIIKSLRKFL